MKDFISGLFFIIAGLFFAKLSSNYNTGMLSNMGPGYFPMLFSYVLIILGLIVIVLKIKNGRN
jgi:hypothetical protein